MTAHKTSYSIFLHGGIQTTVDVVHGYITDAQPRLTNAVGLPFKRFAQWVHGKGGEIYEIHQRCGNQTPILSKLRNAK